MWLAHIATVFTFMLYVPTSKHAHVIFAPVNYFLVTDTPKGALSKINLEDSDADFLIDGISTLRILKTMMDKGIIKR